MRALSVMAALFVLGGCPNSSTPPDAGPSTDAGPDAPASDVPDAPTLWDGGPRFVGTQTNKLDFLVVTEEDAMFTGPLRAGIPWMTRGIRAAADIDIRIAVLGSDLGDPAGEACELPSADGGALLECDTSDAGLFFNPADMTREEITAEMRCRYPRSTSLVEGARECQLAQSFDALVAAMSPARGAVGLNTPAAHGDGINAPFFRRDAFLAVLVLTSPDDCSLADPELTVSDRYDGETALQRCVFNPEALRPVSDVARRLLRIRGPATFGIYSVSNMPAELSGRPAQEILDDPRMASGTLIREPIAHALSSGWDPEGPIVNQNRNVGAGRRIVELSAELDARGVHTKAISYQLETMMTGEEAFEEAVAPVVGAILQGLRQTR